jgi:hypothetical protein
MASNIAIGALSRTHASAAGAWCSGTCSIWVRSTTLRNWRGRRSIEVLEDGAARPRTLSLFPEDRVEGLLADASVVGVRLSELRLRRARQWGACWLALTLWRDLFNISYDVLLYDLTSTYFEADPPPYCVSRG